MNNFLILILLILGCKAPTNVGVYSEHEVKVVRKVDRTYQHCNKRIIELESSENKSYSCTIPDSLTDDWWAGLQVNNSYIVTWEEKDDGRYLWTYKRINNE